MEDAARNAVRTFIGDGLKNWEEEDPADARGNVVWTRMAERDWKELPQCCTEAEKKQFQDTLAALEENPKLAANANDSLLDLEGVRCYGCGKLLLFYRYNSNFNLLTLVRLAYNRPEWKELIRDGKKFH